jgi:MFS family permease
MPMALPQTHLIAFCSDLGILPSHGAAMLSVVLGSGFLCRQLWGWFSDRTGGLVTLTVCSATQATALTAFLMTQDEIGLFTVSAFFGLGFSGLVPAYVLVLREFFPVKDAQWRVPTLLLFSGFGMAAGAWMGGALYDLFGYYGPAFSTRSLRTCSISLSSSRCCCGSVRIADLRSRLRRAPKE